MLRLGQFHIAALEHWHTTVVEHCLPTALPVDVHLAHALHVVLLPLSTLLLLDRGSRRRALLSELQSPAITCTRGAPSRAAPGLQPLPARSLGARLLLLDLADQAVEHAADLGPVLALLVPLLGPLCSSLVFHCSWLSVAKIEPRERQLLAPASEAH